MYLQEGAPWGSVYQCHLEHYGHPAKFGYKGLIPLRKAEKWDAAALARYFNEIGARYIVAVAVHHDNFDNHDSTYQPWNSVRKDCEFRRDVILSVSERRKGSGNASNLFCLQE